MNTHAAKPRSRSAPAAAYPRWVTFERYCSGKDRGSSRRAPPAEANTLVSARTTTGHLIQVSLRLAEPPAPSCVCLHLPDGVDCGHSRVLAAHGDSVLVEVNYTEGPYGRQHRTTEYFVYSAGAAAAEPPRPPSLSLLPGCGFTEEEQQRFRGGTDDPRHRLLGAAGLLRRGDDEVVVAELVMDPEPEVMSPVLFVYKSDDSEWSVKRPQISSPGAHEGRRQLSSWRISDTDTIVPLGDRRLCWVNVDNGVLLCDVLEERPVLQYVPFPADACLWGMRSNRNVSVTAGGAALKLVSVFQRCCCGGSGASTCDRSLNAYVVTTWTLRMGGGTETAWVKDGVVDATELWALDAYKGLECVPLDYPLVSLHEPDVICFFLSQPPQSDDYYGRTLRLLMVNVRRKTIHAVSSRGDVSDPWKHIYRHTPIPSDVSEYFNSRPSSRARDAALPAGSGRRQMGIQRPPPQALVGERLRDDGSGSDSTPRASEIFAALEEIARYGLGRDEVKAYRVLSQHDGGRFRSFLRLPRNMRKDWLLMEINKAS